jgi:hypothetical protein
VGQGERNVFIVEKLFIHLELENGWVEEGSWFWKATPCVFPQRRLDQYVSGCGSPRHVFMSTRPTDHAFLELFTRSMVQAWEACKQHHLVSYVYVFRAYSTVAHFQTRYTNQIKSDT